METMLKLIKMRLGLGMWVMGRMIRLGKYWVVNFIVVLVGIALEMMKTKAIMV